MREVKRALGSHDSETWTEGGTRKGFPGEGGM